MSIYVLKSFGLLLVMILCRCFCLYQILGVVTFFTGSTCKSWPPAYSCSSAGRLLCSSRILQIRFHGRIALYALPMDFCKVRATNKPADPRVGSARSMAVGSNHWIGLPVTAWSCRFPAAYLWPTPAVAFLPRIPFSAFSAELSATTTTTQLPRFAPQLVGHYND